MKSYQKILGLFSLAIVSGCWMPKVRAPEIQLGSGYNPPDLDLTLIYKEPPPRYPDFFSRTELHFSTNKSQQTHAILKRRLTSDLSERLKTIPLGTSMKESEWDRVLINKEKIKNGLLIPVGNWQRFY